MNTVMRGKEAEREVRQHLEREGWTVIAANWRAGRLELDLVAVCGTLLVFFEVKSRMVRSDYPHPYALRPAQKRRLVTASRLFLARHPAWAQHYCRYDVIFHIRDGKGGSRLEHVTNAYLAA